jgi:t-SNARE complex subunit (syntaxin)
MSSSSEDCADIVSSFRSKITVSLPKGPKGTSEQDQRNKKAKQSTVTSSSAPLNEELESQVGQLKKNLEEFIAYTENLEKRLKVEQSRNFDLHRHWQTAEKENQILSKQLRDIRMKGTASPGHHQQELHDDMKAVESTSKVSRAGMSHREHDQSEFHRSSSNLVELYSTIG